MPINPTPPAQEFDRGLRLYEREKARAKRRSLSAEARALALSMRNACEEHLTILNDEMIAGKHAADDAELDDLQAQIDNWTHLLRKCEIYLAKAKPKHRHDKAA